MTMHCHIIKYLIAVARPGETTDIQAISSNDFTLFVSWSPPSNTNGVVISYSVNITNLKDNSVVRQDTISADGNITERGLGSVPYDIVCC